MEFGDHGIIGGTTRWPDDDTGYTYSKHKACPRCGRIIHNRARFCMKCARFVQYKVKRQVTSLLDLSAKLRRVETLAMEIVNRDIGTAVYYVRRKQ